MIRCRLCDDELTYPLDTNEFECGILCDQCLDRYLKYDDYRVWYRYKKLREYYHALRRQEDDALSE